MQLADILCYVILTVTVTASCVAAEEQDTEIEETQDGKRISKREATLILEDYPLDRIFQKPKVIYRRISKQRYGPPKSKYGPPKPKYRPPKVTRKPSKKMRKGSPRSTHPTYRTPIKNKHGSNLNRKRAPKPKDSYNMGKSRPKNKLGAGHIVKLPNYSYMVSEKPSFGEPPVPRAKDYQDQKQSYGEPPVDSYGAPLRTSISDIYLTPQSFQGTSQQYDVHGFNRHEYQWTKHTQSPDSKYTFSNKKPTYADNQIFVTPTPKDYNEEALESETVDNKQVMQDSKFFFRKKRPFYFADSKVVNRPWKPNKQDDFDDEIIVGGQYAEPPARYVSKHPSQSPMYDDDEDDDSFTPLHGYVDTDMALSANNSPYSNYKHSNMAFSPQNLNDAFSIVD